MSISAEVYNIISDEIDERGGRERRGDIKSLKIFSEVRVKWQRNNPMIHFIFQASLNLLSLEYSPSISLDIALTLTAVTELSLSLSRLKI